MPRFDLELVAQSKIANEIVLAGEQSRVREGLIKGGWTENRLEFLHEFAYLRIFSAWEDMLESVFLRSLCGYASRAGGQEILAKGTYHKTLLHAEMAVLSSESRGTRLKTFLLWHGPDQLIKRCQFHIKSGPSGGPAIQERIISSSKARLEALAAVRHRIVHEQDDARFNFDAATLAIAGRRYPLSRPGKFLRDEDLSGSRPRKWLDALTAELCGLASQMV
jgi:hypothetical protein